MSLAATAALALSVLPLLALAVSHPRAAHSVLWFWLGFLYLLRHQRVGHLREPQRFTEWVQWRKLQPVDPRQPSLIDKLAVKPWVAARIGTDWVIPTLWSGERPDPAPPAGPPLMIMKSRHGCNQWRVIGSVADWTAARRASRRWLAHAYGFWLGERAYADVPRGVIVEPFIGADGALPVDYKFYVFAGEVAAVQVHVGRGTARHRWQLLDPLSWCPLASSDRGGPGLPPPPDLAAMTAAAAVLGRDFDFVRVDLYDTAAGPRFGEMSFFPGSGLDRFVDERIDADFGARWAAARSLNVARASTPRAPRSSGWRGCRRAAP